MSDSEKKPIPQEWLVEFEAAARRPLRDHWKYCFIKTYARYRVFDTMEEYRRWCEDNWV